jgi:hypothetical protein
MYRKQVSRVARSQCSTYGLVVTGHAPSVRERLDAITVERRIEHPGALCNRGREDAVGAALAIPLAR